MSVRKHKYYETEFKQKGKYIWDCCIFNLRYSFNCFNTLSARDIFLSIKLNKKEEKRDECQIKEALGFASKGDIIKLTYYADVHNILIA